MNQRISFDFKEVGMYYEEIVNEYGSENVVLSETGYVLVYDNKRLVKTYWKNEFNLYEDMADG